MTSAHLVCHNCRQHLHVGKVRYGTDEVPHGFAHGKYSPQQLSALIEAFLAVHLQHKVEAIAEQDFDMQDWSGYTALRPLPTVTAAKSRVRTLMVGPVEVRVEPQDGPSGEA